MYTSCDDGNVDGDPGEDEPLFLISCLEPATTAVAVAVVVLDALWALPLLLAAVAVAGFVPSIICYEFSKEKCMTIRKRKYNVQ